jgi:hypothetical protein
VLIYAKEVFYCARRANGLRMKEIYGHAAANLNASSWKKLDAI